MKILQLTAENVKKLTVVQIEPDGNLVQITGKNGQGKTSVLDAIWWLLAGGENVQSKPIRNGADSARIEAKLGDGKTVKLIVERRFTEKASYLSVKTSDGAKYGSPQKLMDDLIGTLAFDPLGFMRADSRKQFETLRGLVQLDEDIDEIDHLNKADFDARTIINRDIKQNCAAAVAIAVPEGLPEKPVDEEQLLGEMQQASEFNVVLERRKAGRREVASNIAGWRSEAASLREQAAQLLEQATGYEQTADEAQRDLDKSDPIPSPKDLTELRARLDQAKAINVGIAARNQREIATRKADDLEARSDALTRVIQDRTAKKNAAIAAAKMPIDGLSFGDGVITFNGVPLDQASDAEQLMVSTSIAAALNPKLRVLRIRDGSLLDDDAMARLATFAAERDFQIWIERVDGSGAVGFVMEDGHIKGQAPVQEAAE
jgi:AAA domain